MKHITKYLLTLLIFNFSFFIANAQVAINENGNAPDSSAMLDVSSTDKGLLIPRMDSTARENIVSPAEGLMVFDSTTNSFWYYTNSWQEITGDNLGNHTATQNINLNGNYLSGDGERKGIFIDEEGNIGFGIEPSSQFEFSIFEDTSLVLDAAATSSNNQGAAANGRWQSYTALVSGTVAELRLNFGSLATGTRELLVYEGEGTSGTLLASTESDVTDRGEIIFNLAYEQTANQKYTILLPNGLGWSFDNNGADNYPDGISNVSDAQDFTFQVFLSGLESQSVTLDSLGLTLDNYTLPLEDGQADQVLITDGNGQLDWQDLYVFDSLSVSTGSEGVENLGANYSASVCCVFDDPGFTNWQSYKATANGTLTRVELRFNIGSGDRTVSIYKGEGDDGTLLGSATADISSSASTYNISFDFSDQSIVQETDSIYTIQIDDRERLTFVNPGGYDDGSNSFPAGIDIYFQTYVQPSIKFEVNGAGVSINDYTFPPTDGTSDQLLSTDGNGNLSWVDEPTFMDTDDQMIDTLRLYGTTLAISLEDDGEVEQTVDLSSLDTDTDDQMIDTLRLYGTTLAISLEDDGEVEQTVDLSSLDTDTDDQTIDKLNLNGTTLEISLEDDGESDQTLDLASIDTDTDNQTIDKFNLNGTTLEISLEDDGESDQTVDLASLQDDLGDHTATQNIQLNDNWLSNDGGNEGIQINDNGGVSTSNSLSVGGNITGVTNFYLDQGTQRLTIRADQSAGRIHFDVGGTNASNDAFVFGDLSNGKNALLTLGNVGVGTFSAPQKLTVGVSGDGTKGIANDWDTWSDIRLKRDFQKITNPLQKLNAINGYYYYWRADKLDQSKQIGVIAQEVETILPEIVSTNPDGYKSVDYSKLTAFLIEVNQAQQQQIEEQGAKINQLEAMLESLQAQVSNSINTNTTRED